MSKVSIISCLVQYLIIGVAHGHSKGVARGSVILPVVTVLLLLLVLLLRLVLAFVRLLQAQVETDL